VIANAVRIAVIGCGRIAGHHCRSIAATDGVDLAAVCDLAADKAGAYATEFGVPSFTDYRKMLASMPDIDLVVVATPSGMHFEHAMEFLTRYGKHIVVEKPTFMRPEQLIGAYEAADAAGRRIFPVFQNRYNRAVRFVKAALDAGTLGDIRLITVRTRWCRPQRYYDLAPWRGTLSHDGGALTNQGIHHIDLLRYLGGDVDRVNAVMRTLGAKIEAEDTVVATFTYGGGSSATGTLEVTTAARPDDFEASLSIVGGKGLAQIGGIAVNELQIFTPEPEACGRESEDFSRCVYGFGHENLYRDISATFHQEHSQPISREDCLATIRLLHAFYRSDEVGGWVSTADHPVSERLGRSNEEISQIYRTPSARGATS